MASLTGETTCGICHRNHWILACDKFLTCFVSIFFRLSWNKGSHLVRKNTAKRDPSSYLHHDASRNEQMISESWVIQRCRSLEELGRKQLSFWTVLHLLSSSSLWKKIQQNAEETSRLGLVMVSSTLVFVLFVERQWNRIYRPKLARIVQMLILQPEKFQFGWVAQRIVRKWEYRTFKL